MKLLTKNFLILSVVFTHNNMLCTLTDLKGKSLMWTTIGQKKPHGIKKTTNTSIFLVVQDLYKYTTKMWRINSIYIKIKGTNKNKSTFIKLLKIIGFNILMIQERTTIPHGGCKKPQRRRL